MAFEGEPAMAAALPRHAGLEIRAGDFLAARAPAPAFDLVGNIPYGPTGATGGRPFGVRKGG
jgi:16S rRNA A1518/A1519 N6-dimethyltransferase RsmA/KsgA/DIM1 with predicted DNA glycosylase/AP lyase activity